MATTYTTIWRLAQLEPLDPTTSGSWGTIQEATMQLMEQGSVGITPIDLTGETAVTLTTANNAPDQARLSTLNFTGALTGACTVTIPNIARWGWVVNNTTGGENVVLQTSGPSATLTVPPGQMYVWQCDGSNNVTAPVFGSAGTFTVESGGLVVLAGGVTVGSGTAAIGATANNGVSLTGTAGNDAPSAGQVGEFISSQILRSAAIACGSNVAGTVTSISLTAGDWDVWGSVGLDVTGNASLSQGWISTVANVIPPNPNAGAQAAIAFAAASMTGTLLPVGQRVLNLAGTTTVYLGIEATFTGNGTCYGFIGARRRR